MSFSDFQNLKKSCNIELSDLCVIECAHVYSSDAALKTTRQKIFASMPKLKRVYSYGDTGHVYPQIMSAETAQEASETFCQVVKQHVSLPNQYKETKLIPQNESFEELTVQYPDQARSLFGTADESWVVHDLPRTTKVSIHRQSSRHCSDKSSGNFRSFFEH